MTRKLECLKCKTKSHFANAQCSNDECKANLQNAILVND